MRWYFLSFKKSLKLKKLNTPNVLSLSLSPSLFIYSVSVFMPHSNAHEMMLVCRRRSGCHAQTMWMRQSLVLVFGCSTDRMSKVEVNGSSSDGGGRQRPTADCFRCFLRQNVCVSSFRLCFCQHQHNHDGGNKFSMYSFGDRMPFRDAHERRRQKKTLVSTTIHQCEEITTQTQHTLNGSMDIDGLLWLALCVFPSVLFSINLFFLVRFFAL